MKTVVTAMTEVRKWLKKHLPTKVTSRTVEQAVLSLALGNPTAAALSARWKEVRDWALEWRRLPLPPGARLEWMPRRLHRSEQSLPTHLVFTSLTAAAEFAGDGWPQQLEALRSRWSAMTGAVPRTASSAILRKVSGWTDVDFELLLAASAWFTVHDATGLTPRQVPVAGMQGKWLNKHHWLISTLAGKADLGLIARPTRVHFTYLDPVHRGSGGRFHDSLTIGDHVRLPYQPSTVIVLENKDTAVLFPALADAIAVEGNGAAAPALLPRIPWITAASKIIYWGDMDAAGYEIVDRLRTAGLPVDTILMNRSAYDKYERFGTSTDEHGKVLPCRPRKVCPTLVPSEREVYENLTTPTWQQHRRIEQERIPLDVALATVLRTLQQDCGTGGT